MRVAVTGSSGLIGSALVANLRADDHDVVRLVRGDTVAQPGVTLVQWDPDHGEIDAAGLEGVDAVVHLSGASLGGGRWNARFKDELVHSRTHSTALLCEAIAGLQNRPRVLVSASAVGYYGNRGDEVLTESSEPGDSFLAELCRRWEAATTVAELADVRVVRIRTALVVGRPAEFLKRMLPLFRLGLGGRLGSGRQWWSWISLDDEVGAIRFLIESDLSGPVNLAAPNPVTNREFTRALARAVHRPAFVPVPAFGPRLALGRQMADEMLFASQRVMPARLTDAGYEFRHPTLDGALDAALG